jgi:hypothetical protein
MCCLKRPFDDQSQSRIRLESEALMALLETETDRIRFICSETLLFEYSVNPIPERAAHVAQWLKAQTLWRPDDRNAFDERVLSLIADGLKSFDAAHLASAEFAGAACFVTTDDRLLNTLRRNPAKVRAIGLIECASEITT